MPLPDEYRPRVTLQDGGHPARKEPELGHVLPDQLAAAIPEHPLKGLVAGHKLTLGIGQVKPERRAFGEFLKHVLGVLGLGLGRPELGCIGAENQNHSLVWDRQVLKDIASTAQLRLAGVLLG